MLSAAEVSALFTARLSCASSTCAACGSGKTLCSGNCVTTSSDNNNCGSCGHVCNTANGETCSAGTCVCSNGALADCSSYCVDETTDTNNCGACGNVCGNSTPAFVDSGLLAHWALDEGTGTTSADATGNGRTATLTNSPTWAPGYSGQGLTFDGATNYINATLGTWFGGNNPLTASAWVYATTSTNGPIFGVTNTPPGGGWNMPFLSIAGATVYGHLWQVNGNNPLSATVSLNAWHHLAITYDPTAGEKFYVDGTLSSSATGTYSPSGASDTWTTYISGWTPPSVGAHLNGEIDDVRAYTRVLSAAEIGILTHTRQSCTGSACGGCGAGLTVCSSACTDPMIDPYNCGSCGHACNVAGGETCVSGSCGCATGLDCSGVCIDTTTDNNNCGSCGNVCGTTTCTSCSQGLLGWWHLDEGSGSTSADASGNSRTATLSNGPTWTTGASPGNALERSTARPATVRAARHLVRRQPHALGRGMGLRDGDDERPGVRRHRQPDRRHLGHAVPQRRRRERLRLALAGQRQHAAAGDREPQRLALPGRDVRARRGREVLRRRRALRARAPAPSRGRRWSTRGPTTSGAPSRGRPTP